MSVHAFVLFVLILLVVGLVYGMLDWWRQQREDEEWRRKMREAKRIWREDD